MGREQCFVCGDALALNVEGEISYWKTRNTGGANLLKNNLNVIFLLRKLVKVPGIQLECQLRESGDNPENWISLCDQCTKLIEKARELDEEIQKIERKLKVIRRQVCGKIKAGYSRTTDDKQEEDDQAYLENFKGDFENKMRFFVKNYGFYQLDNDIHGTVLMDGGDKLADYLESQRNSCAAAIVLVKKPNEGEPDSIKMENESPPSLPNSPLPAAVDIPSSPDHFMEDNDEDHNSQGNSYAADIVLVENPDSAGEDEQDEIKVEQESPTPPDSPLSAAADISHHFADHDDKVDEEEEGHNEKEGKVETDPDNYSCSVCDRNFHTSDGLSRHLKVIHKKRYGRSCPLCPEMDFEANIYLYRHLFQKHKDGPESVIQKLREETGLILRSCTMVGCGVYFMKQADEDKHMVRGVHGWNGEHPYEDRVFKCKYCGRRFEDNYKCRRHEITYETKGKTCRKKITRKTTTGGKERVKKLPAKRLNKFKCDICGEMFGWARNWSDHLRNLHGKKDITCPVLECRKFFKDDLAEFRKHWKTRHVTSVTKRAPTKENKKKPGLLELLEKDCDGNSCSCSFCGRKFKVRPSLIRHLKLIHEKKFPKSCPLCGRGFENNKYLNRHLLGKHKDDPVTIKLREETGLFLRKCKVVGCCIQFMKQVEEDRHMERVHGGKGGGGGDEGPVEGINEKTFMCKYCGRGFWDKGKCGRHEKIHEEKGKVRVINRKSDSGYEAGRSTRSPPGSFKSSKFKCDICGKGFKLARNWSDHLWNTHDKREITCPGLEMECGRIFNNLVEFQDHWKSSHVTESGEKFICEICGMEKESRSDLSLHRNNTHRKKKNKGDKRLSTSLSGKQVEGKFSCGICGKGCISQRSLWAHKRKVHQLGRHDQPVRERRKKGDKMGGLKVTCNICGGREFSSEITVLSIRSSPWNCGPRRNFKRLHIHTCSHVLSTHTKYRI